MNKFEKAYYDIILETNETSNIAKEPGRYENFTGTINFGWNKGTVKNATFELSTYLAAGFDRLKIIWEDGIWEDGNWDSGTWHAGTWKNGKWRYGNFLGGVFENGQVWEGYFSNMTWKDGHATRGKFTNCTIENGKIGATISSLTVENCIIENGEFKCTLRGDNSIFKNGTFKGIWYDGTFKGGTFDGYFISGIFEGGTFENGEWNFAGKDFWSTTEQPIWKGGTWKQGRFLYRTFIAYKTGSQAGKPKKFESKSIETTKNPNEILKELKQTENVYIR
jgi:hypothetical protein